MDKYILLLILTLVSHPVLAAKKCIAPSPDNFAASRSPELQGKIIQFEDSFLVVLRLDNKQFKVHFNSNSLVFFSQFGGMLTSSELKNGETIKIWTKDCLRIGQSSKVIADKIMVIK